MVKCFDKLDEDDDGALDLQNMLAARNAGGEDGEAGLVPRCGETQITWHFDGVRRTFESVIQRSALSFLSRG